MFHPNKDILSETEWNKWYNVISGLSANEQRNIDEYKKNLALDKKINYIEVWENETFTNNKNKIINKILQLYDNTTKIG